MNFMELKDQFIQKYKDYSNDVCNFLDYLQNKRKIKLPDLQDFMVNGMNTEQIIESLKYNVENGRIKKKEPARKYFVTLKQLFEYVLNNSNYKNDNFKSELANPVTRDNSYTRKTNKFIKEYTRLKPKETYGKLDNQSVSTLVDWCDESIKKVSLTDGEVDETDFRRMAAALCIKLMILTGITYREVRKLKFENLDAQINTIIINEFKIRLPSTLSMQFQKYSEIIRKRINADFLFVDLYGTQWGDATSDSGIPTFMKTVINQTNLTGIVKYGITQLIQSGVNDSIIMKLTGASRELINGCLEDLQIDDLYWEQKINSKIVTTDLYYHL